MTCARERVPTNLTFCQQEVNECNNSQKKMYKKKKFDAHWQESWKIVCWDDWLTNCGVDWMYGIVAERGEIYEPQPQQKAFYGNL